MTAIYSTNYSAWLSQVDYLLRTRFGLKLNEITAYDWHSAFDQGMTPAVAAALGVMAR
ncbi:hypothetical protein [Nocardia jiangxiensis]|uniref:hypothetical protein n=1 Tax=Nocardia jiangxiensis TaxID=282685 RepID=UPI0002DF81DC|nr:hypothetical protein [Nocardia jiangxiensis]